MPKPKNNEFCKVCERYIARYMSIDAVIIYDKKILLVKRGINPFIGYWALPGGYMDWDETTEEATKREVKEETNLGIITTELIGVYSRPSRHEDQTITTAYRARIDGKSIKNAKAGDDAAGIKWFDVDKLPENIAFDHRQIIKDAINN